MGNNNYLSGDYFVPRKQHRGTYDQNRTHLLRTPGKTVCGRTLGPLMFNIQTTNLKIEATCKICRARVKLVNPRKDRLI